MRATRPAGNDARIAIVGCIVEDYAIHRHPLVVLADTFLRHHPRVQPKLQNIHGGGGFLGEADPRTQDLRTKTFLPNTTTGSSRNGTEMCLQTLFS